MLGGLGKGAAGFGVGICIYYEMAFNVTLNNRSCQEIGAIYFHAKPIFSKLLAPNKL